MKKTRRRRKSRKMIRSCRLPRLIICNIKKPSLPLGCGHAIIYQDVDFLSPKNFWKDPETGISVTCSTTLGLTFPSKTIYLRARGTPRDAIGFYHFKKSELATLVHWAKNYPWPKISAREYRQRRIDAERCFAAFLKANMTEENVGAEEEFYFFSSDKL